MNFPLREKAFLFGILKDFVRQGSFENLSLVNLLLNCSGTNKPINGDFLLLSESPSSLSSYTSW